MSQDVIGPDGNGGYQHVVQLAKELVKLRNARYVRPSQADKIVALWRKLADVDKAPVRFRPRHQKSLIKGMFKAGRTGRKASVPGADSLKR
ncbi:MAG: hypothetical protein AAFO83_15385 [Cyanobacteria bacterium J06607_13]